MSETARWVIAVSASVVAHVLLLMGGGQPGTAAPSSPQVTRIQFRSAAVTKAAEAPEPPSPQKVRAEKGGKPAEDPPLAAPTEHMQAQTVEADGSEAAPATNDAVAVSSPSTEQIAPGASEEGLAAARLRYARTLAAHIERYRYYPEAARRRGITGGVHVGFMVSADGSAGALECDKGPNILAGAACDAVRRATPLPRPPPEVRLPVPVNFVMDFALN